MLAGENEAKPRPRLFELGSVAQASVPGVYAWFVTVAPTAWSRGSAFSSGAAKVFALIGLVSLVVPAILEPRWPKGARIASVWGLATTSVIVWALCPTALGTFGSVRFDTARGITGMIGWGLFAYASAAPAVRRSTPPPGESAAPLKPRGRVPRGGSVFIGIGVVLATALQFIGWQATSSPERAVLVRLACLALGLGLIGSSTSIALARHQLRMKSPSRHRLRIVIPWLLAIFLFAVVGLVYRLTR